MVIYPDTSFLTRLYLKQPSAEKALNFMMKYQTPLIFTSFHHFELHNALRLCLFRKEIESLQYKEVLLQIQKDALDGFLQRAPIYWNNILNEAERLSSFYTETLGNRSLDILHVAAAISLKADIFLTFDHRQHALAKKAHLKVKP